MRAINTNVLVFAEIVTSSHHETALQLLTELAEGPRAWAIPWPCIYEFLRVVTYPRVYHPPVPLQRARGDLKSLLASPKLALLSETGQHREVMPLMPRAA